MSKIGVGVTIYGFGGPFDSRWSLRAEMLKGENGTEIRSNPIQCLLHYCQPFGDELYYMADHHSRGL